MAVSQEYIDLITDQLSEFEGATVKKMFGGYGIFKEKKMFGLVGDDTLFLKVDDHNRADYEARGMKQHYMEKKGKGMPYWTVPADVLENKNELKKWAEKAYEAALRAKK